MSQSLLINSPPGQWEKRVVHYETAEPAEVYIHIALYGNPCTVWVDEVEITAEPFRPERPRTDFEDAVTDAQLREILAAREPLSGTVEVRDGRSELLVNGRPVPPVIYKGEPYHTESDFKRFGEAGVPLGTVSVRLGHGRGHPGVWQGRDRYDFSIADEAIYKALRRNPNVMLMICISFYPYTAWGDENPDECWTNAAGLKAYGSWGNLDGFTDDLESLPPTAHERWWYPSYHSPRWQADSAAAAAALVEYLQAQDYWKAIVGFHIGGGHDGQFQVLPYADYTTAAEAGFRQWCRERYEQPANAAARWQLPLTSFDDIRIADFGETTMEMEGDPPYLPPGPLLDYREFVEDRTWTLRDIYAGVLKEAAGKPVFTTAYGNPPDYDFSPFLRTENIDATVSMSYYPYRQAGYASAYRNPRSFPLHGKLFIQELDVRSWVGTLYNDEVYQMWIGAGLDEASWRNIHRKLVGVSLADETGYWYYDMNHYYDALEIMEEIGRVQEQTARLRALPPAAFRPDVCVVRGERDLRYLNSVGSSLRSSRFYQVMALETSGVPYDMHYLSDVLEFPRLQDYRLYIFLDTRLVTDAQRTAIREKLQNNGRTLVFMHDAGYLEEDGVSLEALNELVGMTVRTDGRRERLTPVAAASESPLLAGVRPFWGLDEMLMSVMVQEGRSSFTGRSQPFWIEDSRAEPLLVYHENGRTAGALRELDNWTSVYIGVPSSLGPELLNNLARRAGAYVCSPPGQAIHMNGRFVSIHGMKSAVLPFTPPVGVQQVTEMFSGEVLGTGPGPVEIPIEAQQTVWLSLQ